MKVTFFDDVISPNTIPLSAPQEVSGFPGPVGPTGPAGTSGGLTKITAVAISALKVVSANSQGEAILADKDTSPYVVGVATSSAAQGAEVAIQTSGEFFDATWNWLAGAVYLGNNGALTQTAPTTGYVCQVGISTGPTKFLIRPNQIIQTI